MEKNSNFTNKFCFVGKINFVIKFYSTNLQNLHYSDIFLNFNIFLKKK